MDEFTKGYTKVLLDLEKAFWEREAERNEPSGFTEEALRASSKIFMSILMELMWKDQEKRMLSFEERCEQVERCGDDVKKLIDKYTGLDSTHMYDSYTIQK